MGLDITAYGKLTEVPDPQFVITWEGYDGYREVDDDHWFAWYPVRQDEYFPGRSEGIVRGAVYSFGDTYKFCAGAYHNYNWWRDQLARLAGYKSGEDYWENCEEGAFYELINFSDCDGVLGSAVCMRLDKDFKEHKSEAHKVPWLSGNDREWFIKRYDHFAKAIELAADGGAIVFH